MRGFVAAVVAVLAAAMACAAGAGDAGPGPAIPDPREAGSAIPDTGGAIPTDTGGPVAPDSGEGSEVGTGDDGGVESRDASVLDTGSSDAGRDAEGSVPPALQGSCERGQWVVTASASAPNNPPAFAVDGLPPTRWSTGAGQAVGQYFQVDFGGLVVIDRIALDDSFGTNEHLDYPRGVDVLGSADGINFATTLASGSYATDPGAIVTLSFAPATTRAIRMQLTTGVPSLWWSIHELEVGCQRTDADGGADGGAQDSGASDGGGAVSCAALDAGWGSGGAISPAGWTGSASSTGPNDTIQGAFDQSATTRWSSGQAQAGGEWFKVDLGQATSISGVSLYLLNGNVSDYPSSYALELSSDDLTYATVATGLGGPTTPICVPRQSARYVKVTQTGTGDTAWWSIYEISVFP